MKLEINHESNFGDFFFALELHRITDFGFVAPLHAAINNIRNSSNSGNDNNKSRRQSSYDKNVCSFAE